jgi:hypothetical protein
MFIYLDESGDLGFDFTKQKTTKNLSLHFWFVRVIRFQLLLRLLSEEH